MKKQGNPPPPSGITRPPPPPAPPKVSASNSTDLLSGLPQLHQRQDGLLDQIRDLIPVANRLGMYDAADWLRDMLDR